MAGAPARTVGGGGDDRAADVEHAGGQALGALEAHRDRPDEGPALLGGVLHDHGGELAAQRLVVLQQALGVGRPELDDEVVGDQQPALPDDHLLVGGLPLQGRRDLDGLHDAAEDLGEGTLDQALEPTLEALQHAHARPLPSGS